MKKLMILMFTSIFMFGCEKNDEAVPAVDELAVKMSQEFVAAVNSGEPLSGDVTKYFAEGNPLVTQSKTTIKSGGKSYNFAANKSFQVKMSQEEGKTVEVAAKSKPWKDCRMSAVVLETSHSIIILIIPNDAGCPQGPRFEIELI